MRAQRTYLIGFPMFFNNNSYYYRLYEAPVNYCSNSSFKILGHSMDNSGISAEAVIAAISTLINDARAEGILLPPPFSNDEKVHAWLQKQKIPYASIAQILNLKNTHFGTSDFASGMASLTEHIINLGHKRISFIAGPTNLPPANERKRGFYQSLQNKGLEFDPAYFYQGNFTRESGFAGANALLDFDILPTAILCANDASALAAMQAIHKRGLRVPDDISVAGFDDLAEGELNMVPLTTIHQPL